MNTFRIQMDVVEESRSYSSRKTLYVTVGLQAPETPKTVKLMADIYQAVANTFVESRVDKFKKRTRQKA